MLTSLETSQDRNPIIRIWIAEDDEELREILGSSLSHEHREIRLFNGGQAVLDAIRVDSFDILLTDLMMPGADGIQILKEVKTIHPDGMVIIMTGYASIDTAIEAIRGGAYDYIRKPFKSEELEIVIRNASEKVFLIRENRYLLQRLKDHRDQSTPAPSHRLMTSHDEDTPGMELILNQLNSIPPDYDLGAENFQEKGIDILERLIKFRKEGLIDQHELSIFKKILLKKIDG